MNSSGYCFSSPLTLESVNCLLGFIPDPTACISLFLRCRLEIIRHFNLYYQNSLADTNTSATGHVIAPAHHVDSTYYRKLPSLCCKKSVLHQRYTTLKAKEHVKYTRSDLNILNPAVDICTTWCNI
jgi:hypothetical protein